MNEEVIAEYVQCAALAAQVDYADKRSVRKYNAASDRMRAIVDDVVRLGHDAVQRFAAVLEIEPAAG